MLVGIRTTSIQTIKSETLSSGVRDILSREGYSYVIARNKNIQKDRPEDHTLTLTNRAAKLSSQRENSVAIM